MGIRIVKNAPQPDREKLARNYLLAKKLREETCRLIRQSPDPKKVSDILRQREGSAKYYLQTALIDTKSISYEEAQFLGSRIPENISFVRKLRDTYETSPGFTGLLDRHWNESVSRFVSTIDRLRTSLSININDHNKMTTEFLGVTGSGRSASLHVRLAASWKYLTTKIGSPIVNKTCVIMTARQIFDYEDGLVLYEGGVFDTKDLEFRTGYMCVAKVNDSTFVGCFNESLARAVSMTRNRLSASVMNALAG